MVIGWKMTAPREVGACLLAVPRKVFDRHVTQARYVGPSSYRVVEQRVNQRARPVVTRA
jgi:hypothetical protein